MANQSESTNFIKSIKDINFINPNGEIRLNKADLIRLISATYKEGSNDGYYEHDEILSIVNNASTPQIITYRDYIIRKHNETKFTVDGFIDEHEVSQSLEDAKQQIDIAHEEYKDLF